MSRLFDSVFGHKDIIDRLLGAQTQNRLPSAMIFAGPSGIGKRKVAHALTQALLCEKLKSDACGKCGPCLRVEAGQSEGLLDVEPTGATIKIEQSRDVLQFLTLQKIGRARVIVVDEAQLLNPQAGNALLKVIEEPPPSTYFILISSNSSALLSTIRSRAQLFRFELLAETEIKAVLKSRKLATDDWVLRSAQGRAEIALQLTDPASEWGAQRLKALSIFARGLHGQDILDDLKELCKDKAVSLFVLRTWTSFLRDLIFTQNKKSARVMNSDQGDLLKWGERIDSQWLHILAKRVIRLESDIMGNIDKNLAFEVFSQQLRKASASELAPSLLE
jgi:DNA polymerase-3 subunit delta'